LFISRDASHRSSSMQIVVKLLGSLELNHLLAVLAFVVAGINNHGLNSVMDGKSDSLIWAAALISEI
jgi:hypothetical protein